MPAFYSLTPTEQGERFAALAAEALRRWAIEDADIELVEIRENAVFRVTTRHAARYALRIHRHGYHTRAQLRSELQWLQALRRDGIDVPQVVPTETGDLLTTVTKEGVPEPRQVDLFEWIEGEQLGVVTEALYDREAYAKIYRTVGELTAELHNHAVAWQPPAGFTRHAWDLDGLTGHTPVWGRFWDLDALSASERATIGRARQKVREDLIAYGQSPAHYSIIHADLLPENVLVQGDRVRVIDFDDAGYGWHLFDIATTMTMHRGPAHRAETLKAVVDGYRSRRRLTDEDLEHLALFLVARGFTYLGWMSTRHETDAARGEGRRLIENVCEEADAYMSRSS